MKKKILCIVAVCLVSSYGAVAQLDPNCFFPNIKGPGYNNIFYDGGFERRFREPSAAGDMVHCSVFDNLDGFIPRQTVDYYTTGGTNGFSLANNYLGGVTPRRVGQEAVLGMITNKEDLHAAPTNNYKEYINFDLNNGQLTMNQTYYTEVWVNKSCRSRGVNDQLTLLVGTTLPNAIFGGGTHTLNEYGTISKVDFPGTIATNTSGWQKIAMAFKAKANRNVLALGDFQKLYSPISYFGSCASTQIPGEGQHTIATYYFVDDFYLGKLADAGPDITVDCNNLTTTLSIACASDRYLNPNAAGIPGATYTWKWLGTNFQPQVMEGTTITPSSFLFGQSTPVTLEVKYTNTDGSIITGTDEVIVNNNCCLSTTNLAIGSPYINSGATQGIGPILKSQTINAMNYGGTVTLDGYYQVEGTLTLINGNFNIMPSTRFAFYPVNWNTDPNFDPDPSKMSIKLSGTPQNKCKFFVNSAYFSSHSSLAWLGIDVGINSEISIKGEFCNSTIQYSLYGIRFTNDATPKYFQIDKCSFVSNNFTSILIYGPSHTSSFIKRSLFIKGTVLHHTLENNTIVNNAAKISDSYIKLLRGQGTPITTGTGLTIIQDNMFDNSIFGIVAENISHRIERNRFTNIASIAYLNYSNDNTGGLTGPDYNAGLNTVSSNYLFQNNTIQLPSNWPATPQLPTTNKTCYGIFNTMRANSFNNVITGADNASFNLLTRIGIYNASSFYTRYWDNSFTNLHQGIRLKTFNNGEAELTRNNFVSNIDAVRIANSGVASNKVTTNCNSFTNPAARANTAAIRVEEQAFLNSLQNPAGGNIFPNFNAFSGMARPIEFLGQNSSYASFNYLRSTSAMENPPPPQIIGPSNKNFTASSYAGGCPGATGANRVGIAEEVAVSEGEAKEMLNQIRFKYVNAQDQNTYLRKLISFYGVANKMGDLYNWQKPMNRFNKKAYNTLGLFLMDYFRADGKEAQAQEIANALLTTNSTSKEIAARVRYFNLPQPTAKNKNARTGDATDERDEVLKELAYSGTSVADLACMLLRLNTTNADCPESDSISSNARSAYFDFEEEDELSSDTYLGNCLPNPAKEETVIYFYVPEEANKGLLRINNAANGALMKLYTVSGKDYITLNLADFASGVYTYTLQVNDIPIATKKLVVVK